MALCAALLPGLSGCAEDGSILDPCSAKEGAILDPCSATVVVTLAIPFMLVGEVNDAAERANQPPGTYTPSPDKLWRKAGASRTEMKYALIQCGYRSGQYMTENGAQYAESMAQRAACMEQAGYRYIYSSAKAKYKMFNAGAEQDLSYAGICRAHAKDKLPVCRKGTKLPTMSGNAGRFISFCLSLKKQGRTDNYICSDYIKCVNSVEENKSSCDARKFQQAMLTGLERYFGDCLGEENNKEKPECHL